LRARSPESRAIIIKPNAESITAIAGIPGNSNVVYLGSCSGGVFKTVDGGVSWKAVFEKYPPSIGAIEIAGNGVTKDYVIRRLLRLRPTTSTPAASA